MKTFLGEQVKENTRSILYLCDYDFKNKTIKVFREIQFATPGQGLDAYANAPNPPSQLASGSTKEKLEQELTALNNNLNNPKWVAELSEYL